MELAGDTNRSEGDLAGKAIASFVEQNADQVARIRWAPREAEPGAPGIRHEDIEQCSACFR